MANKQWLKYNGVLKNVLLHTGGHGCSDAEIQVVTTDGELLTVHHYHPTDKDIAILRNGIGKPFKYKVERGKVTL